MNDIIDIVIDPELEALLPELSPDENADLIGSIVKDGFTDPIVVWLGHGCIVDGHNRYRIWRDCLGSDPDKAPEIVEKHFDNRDAVKEWMLRRQLARRNLTDAMRVTIALTLKPVIEAKAKESQKRKSADSVSMKSTKQKVDTRKELAAAAGVSEDKFRKAETVLASDNEPLKDAMLKGDVKVNTAFIEVTAAKGKGLVPVTEPRRNLKPLRCGDVYEVRQQTSKAVTRLLNRVKRTSTEAIQLLPLLANELRSNAEAFQKLAAEVEAKIGGQR